MYEALLCRIDLLQPEVPGEFRFTDFINPTRVRLTGNGYFCMQMCPIAVWFLTVVHCVTALAGAFFSILFNLQKFTLFEQRDPVSVKQELNEQGITCAHDIVG